MSASVARHSVRELRIALVCYGGASLATYMHGVTKEIHKQVRASRGWGPLDGSRQLLGLLGEPIVSAPVTDAVLAERRILVGHRGPPPQPTGRRAPVKPS